MSEPIIETCWNCKGSGVLVFNNVLLGMKQPSGVPQSYMVQCSTCGGTGKISYIPQKNKRKQRE